MNRLIEKIEKSGSDRRLGDKVVAETDSHKWMGQYDGEGIANEPEAFLQRKRITMGR